VSLKGLGGHKTLAAPLSLFAHLQINWNGKTVFVFESISFLKTKQENLKW
jgi:hypothetical protein